MFEVNNRYSELINLVCKIDPEYHNFSVRARQLQHFLFIKEWIFTNLYLTTAISFPSDIKQRSNDMPSNRSVEL